MLLTDGHDVLCVDNFFTGRKENIAHLSANPFFEAMRHDVTFPLYVEAYQIYNLACPASPVSLSMISSNDKDECARCDKHARAWQSGSRPESFNLLRVKCIVIWSHRQTEDYWGRVNPIGIQSLRRGEALCRNLFL